MTSVKPCFTLTSVIRSFRHKGLRELMQSGRSAKVRADLAARLLRRLDAIAAARTPQALHLPGFDFHALQGRPRRYSVHVNGPWCVTFGWDGEDAIEVDLENYH